MGIPGLTTYISKNSGFFYKENPLHDTLLLVDGNSLACQIYLTLTVTNSAFGGDYERFRHSIEKFMKLLLSCNILPIVVFDGGYERRKLKTTLSRLKNTIIGVSSFTSVNQQNNVKLFPMFMKEIFKQVTRDLHIPCVQSDFEADFDLVYLSRKFNCPVLSYDSDFYLNNVEYIPFYNIELKGEKACNTSSTGKALYCKMYRVEYLFRHFGGLSKDFIPLLQCMLGNDYISHMHFSSFLSQLDFRYTSGQKSPVSKRLAVLIKWCKSQQSLETALGKIIVSLKRHQKSEAIKQLKRSILDYKTEDCILYPYVMEQIVKYNQSRKLEELQEIQKMRSIKMETYKHPNYALSFEQMSDTGNNFYGNSVDEGSESGTDNKSLISELDTEEEMSNENEQKENTDFGSENTYEIADETQEENTAIPGHMGKLDEVESITKSCKQRFEQQFNSTYLNIAWLVDEFRHCNISSHIANMFNLGTIFLSPLRENIKLESVHVASYPILQSLGKVLLQDSDRGAVLKVYTRDIARMTVVRLKCNGNESDNTPDEIIKDSVMNGAELNILDSGRKDEKCNVPSKYTLQDIPAYKLAFRRGLLLKKLKLFHLDAALFNGDLFPQEWNLFIISLIYWCNNSHHVNRYHVSCIIISFIYLNIVQSHCGYFESTSSFKRKYAKKLNAMKTEFEMEKIERKKCKKSKKKKIENASEIASADGTNPLSDEYPENRLTSNSAIKQDFFNDITVDDLDKYSLFSSILKIVDTNTVNIDQLILLYEQFFQLSHLDENLRSNHTNFNKDVIHVFCEYQSIFYFITMFNSALMFPFQELEMSKIYSGTFIYNVYCKIYKKDNCIPLLFEHSTDMFEVYKSIVNVIEHNTNTDVFKVIERKVKRKKKKKIKLREEEIEESKGEARSGGEEEEILIDSDNIYSLLQDVCI